MSCSTSRYNRAICSRTARRSRSRARFRYVNARGAFKKRTDRPHDRRVLRSAPSVTRDQMAPRIRASRNCVCRQKRRKRFGTVSARVMGMERLPRAQCEHEILHTLPATAFSHRASGAGHSQRFEAVPRHFRWRYPARFAGAKEQQPSSIRVPLPGKARPKPSILKSSPGRGIRPDRRDARLLQEPQRHSAGPRLTSQSFQRIVERSRLEDDWIARKKN